MATTHLQLCLGDTTKPHISSCLPVATEIRKIKELWLLYDHSTRLHGLGLQNANTNITVTICMVSMRHLEELQAWNPVHQASVDPRLWKETCYGSSGPHLVVYENKLVLNLLYLEQITRRLLPDAVHQGKQALFPWVVWDKSTPHTFLISVISFV